MAFDNKQIYTLIHNLYYSKDRMGIYIEETGFREFTSVCADFTFTVGRSQEYPRFTQGINSMTSHDILEMGMVSIFYFTKDVTVDGRYCIDDESNINLNRKLVGIVREQKLKELLNDN